MTTNVRVFFFFFSSLELALQTSLHSGGIKAHTFNRLQTDRLWCFCLSCLTPVAMIPLAYTRSILGKIIPKVHRLFSPKYLLLTNMAITSSLSSLGDILQQSYEITIQRQENWNKTRTFHVSITGLVLGPPCHFWYKFLDHYLPGRAPRVIVKKLVLDQIFCAPVMIFLFLTTLGLLEKSSLQQMWVDFEECGKPLLLADWLVWPPAQVINFYFLPSKYRVLYDNIISLGFDIYYSFVKFCRDRKSGNKVEEICDSDKDT